MNDIDLRWTKRKRILIVVLVLVVSTVALVLLASYFKVRLIDFTHYLTASDMLLRHADPYSAVEFFAPPYIAVLLAPLTLLPLEVASAIWLFIAALSQIGVGVIALSWTRGVHSRVLRLVIPFIPIFVPAAFFSYITGQLSPLVTVSALLTTWMVFRSEGHPVLIGILVGLAALKPHIVVIPLALVFFEMARWRRWGVLFCTVGVLVLLLIISFALLPGWIPALIRAWQGGAYLGGPGLVAPGYIGMRELGIPVWAFIPLIGYTAWLWAKEGLSSKVVSLAFTTSLLLIPYARSYDHVVLVVPFLFVMLTKERKLVPTIVILIAVGVLPFTILWPLSPVLVALAVIMI